MIKDGVKFSSYLQKLVFPTRAKTCQLILTQNLPLFLSIDSSITILFSNMSVIKTVLLWKILSESNNPCSWVKKNNVDCWLQTVDYFVKVAHCVDINLHSDLHPTRFFGAASMRTSAFVNFRPE